MSPALFWCLVLACLFSVGAALSSVDGDHFPSNRPKRCTRHRAFGKRASDCHRLELQSVPTNLNTDIQVLDLSYNRIRELNRESLERYTSLEMLFLDDNMVSFIADDTFEPLQSLDVVLLNLNAISEVPTSLFSLPYLRKVDLSENRLSLAGVKIISEAPLTNQVKWLGLSACHLQRLPVLDNFVHLEFLNVSRNPLIQLDALELAPLCSLKQLDLGKSYKLLSPCNCHLLAQWSTDNQIVVYPPEALACAATEDAGKHQCHSSNSTQQAEMLRARCATVLAEKQKQAHMTKVWIYVGAVVLAILGIVLIVGFWMVRRRRRRFLRPVNNNNSGSCDGKTIMDSGESTLLSTSCVTNGTGDVIMPAAQNCEDRLIRT